MNPVVCVADQLNFSTEFALVLPVSRCHTYGNFSKDEHLVSGYDVQIVQTLDTNSYNQANHFPIPIISRLIPMLSPFPKVIQIKLIDKPEGIKIGEKELIAFKNFCFRELQPHEPRLRLDDISLLYYSGIEIRVMDYNLVDPIFNLLRATSLDQISLIGDTVIGYNA